MRCRRGNADRPEAHRSPSVPFFLYPDVQWAFPRLREVVEDLQAFRPDVVHVATEFSLGIAGVKAARQLELPLIASAHTDYDQYAARYGVTWALRAGWHYLRWFYGQAHRVLCPSRIYEQALHRHGVLHTGLWSRGVDPRVFAPRYRGEAYRARARASGPGDLLVTYIGRIAREKNLGLLLEAWETLAPERGGAQLVLVGRGPLEEDIRRREIPGVHVTGLLQGRRALHGLRVGRRLRVSVPHRDVRQFAARGDGLGARLASSRPAAECSSSPSTARNAWLVEPDSARGHRWRAPAPVAATPRFATAWRDGALATARERDWGAVYDRLLDGLPRGDGGDRRRPTAERPDYGRPYLSTQASGSDDRRDRRGHRDRENPGPHDPRRHPPPHRRQPLRRARRPRSRR